MLLIFFCCISSSCKVAALSTTWKNQDLQLPLEKNSRILAVCILKDSSLPVRDSIELQVAGAFNRLGYRAVSSIQQYGREGLSNQANEDTYRSLRISGTDIIITIALINKEKDVATIPFKGNNYPAKYYYNRITSYKDIVGDVSAQETDATANAYWEAIVFDLHTLTPVVVMRSPSYYSLSALDLYTELPALIMARLQKEKVVGLTP